MQNPRALVVATLLALCVGASAPEPTPRPALSAAQVAAIDRFAQAEMARTHVPGESVGIYSRGDILLAKGYGLANVELDVPVKPETIFQSGSVGKQFVSAAIMMLVEQGRLSLRDSIRKYFPDAPLSWKPIRIQNLLSHTSGLSEYESDERTGPNGPFYLRLDFTENQLMQRIEALPIENPPGARWNYRNTNYAVLGVLIHRITGMFYADYLAKHIFRPLGMSSTRLISEHDIVPNRSAGYQWENGTLKNQDWVSPSVNSTADGALYFNVLDLAKWDAALYTTQLLSISSLDRMWTVYPLNDGKPNPGKYGFAWEIDRQNGHRVIEHGGAWQGFTCEISRYPDDSLTVVVLTNLDAGHSRPDYAANVIAGLVDPALMPAPLSQIPDDRPQIAQSLASLLNRIVGGAKLRTLIAPELQEEITPGADVDVRSWVTPMWPGGTLSLVRRRPSRNGANTVSEFRLTKGSRSILIWYGLNARGMAVSLDFQPDEQYRT